MDIKSGWQLTGDAPEAYETHIAPAFSASWARDLVRRASLKQGERLLDVACGTGIVARQAVESVGLTGHVAGVDVNGAMLDKARLISGRSGADIAWKQGDACDLPFTDASFDAVLCQQGLQYFPDRELALREMHRVLVPDGRIIASVWRAIRYFPFYTALHNALDRYLGADDAKTLASAFTLGDTEMLRALFHNAGYKNVRIRLVIKQMRAPSLTAFFYGGMAASPFAGAISALDDENRNGMCQTVENALSDYMDDDGLAAPMECHVVTAGK